MSLVSESDRERRAFLAEHKRRGEAYAKLRDARIAEHKAVEQQSFKDIQSIARSLVYHTASNAQPTKNARGVDDRSDSEYEPDAEEEAHAEEEAVKDEEEAALAMPKTMTAMEQKRGTQSEGEDQVSDTMIDAEVLKEKNVHITFLSSMGYASRSGRSGSSASSAQIRDLEERIEQKDREARDANGRHQEELAARLEAQERALEEMEGKQQEELEAVKKSQ